MVEHRTQSFRRQRIPNLPMIRTSWELWQRPELGAEPWTSGEGSSSSGDAGTWQGDPDNLFDPDPMLLPPYRLGAPRQVIWGRDNLGKGLAVRAHGPRSERRAQAWGTGRAGNRALGDGQQQEG